MENAVIAGPTCDSADIMYENYKYGLPLNLAIGDRLYWLSTGAYTTSLQLGRVQWFPAAEGLLRLTRLDEALVRGALQHIEQQDLGIGRRLDGQLSGIIDRRAIALP